MRVCFVTNEFSEKNKPVYGGLASYLYKVAKILQKLGHEPIILVMDNKNGYTYYDGIEIIRKRSRITSLLYEIKLQRIMPKALVFISAIENSILINKEIRRMHKNAKIDIIQFANLQGLALFYYLKIPAILRLSSYSKLYCTVGIQSSSEQLKITSFIERWSSKFVDGIIAPSIVTGKAYGADVKRKVVIIETPYYNEKLIYNMNNYQKYLKDKKYILFYGTLYDVKGIYVIANMIEKFLHNFPDYNFAFVGKVGFEKNRNPITELLKNAGEYKERVIYIPAMPHESLYPIIENAELVVLPSIMENLANACIEAMGLGKIVIGTDGTSFEQLIEDGYNGFLSIPGNADSLYNKVHEALILSDVEKKIMSEKAIERIKKLRPEITIKRLINYYNYIINAKKKNGK